MTQASFSEMLVLIVLSMSTTLAMGLLNPGVAIGIKSSSPKALLLHPSLTSTQYLETKPVKRRRSKAQTNFALLKNSLLEGKKANIMQGRRKISNFGWAPTWLYQEIGWTQLQIVQNIRRAHALVPPLLWACYDFERAKTIIKMI